MALSSPGAPSTMRNSGRRSPRLMRSSRTVRQASALSPPMLLIASNTLWPSAHPPRIGAGEIRARDQRVGCERPALVGPQRLALPFRRLALGGVQSGARHRDLDRPERSRQRPRPAAVAVARNARAFFLAGHLAS